MKDTRSQGQRGTKQERGHTGTETGTGTETDRNRDKDRDRDKDRQEQRQGQGQRQGHTGAETGTETNRNRDKDRAGTGRETVTAVMPQTEIMTVTETVIKTMREIGEETKTGTD